MRAVQIERFGGPEVLELADLAVPAPGEGEVLIRVARAGINFADTHRRENSYLAGAELPLVLGGEVAGTVERAGGGFRQGETVVALLDSGGYAQYAVAPAQTTFRVPEDLELDAALALVLQGLTAWHLYRTSAKLAPGESVVVHAAAGGVGSIEEQLAKPFGAGRVIASASSEPKRRLALELGADAAVDSEREGMTAALLEANRGRRVDVVLDMAGGRTFEESLEALAPFGRLVTYGIASRQQNEVRTGHLMRKSRAVVGFWLAHCLRDRSMTEEPLADLFRRATEGSVQAQISGTYPLSEVRRAHDDLQGRRTSGKLLLDPDA